MIDRKHIGFSTPPSSVTIDVWRVRLFCQAIGERDAVYWDAEVAAKAGYKACPVPPTFLKAIETEHFSSAILMERLGVPLRTVLHAAQSFDYHLPLHVGERIEISRRIRDTYDKRDGALSFIVIDTQYRRDGITVASSCQTIVTRNGLASTEQAA
ncbi:MaoC family dehydratase N-terminal domain-containing protein [Variovorax sp. LjRoot290]|uniref:FAS1-like dehydratase domain-containing protein n=1 Tax=unclassified Variovorax TaxID=663243 RepID=UPI003ECC7855